MKLQYIERLVGCQKIAGFNLRKSPQNLYRCQKTCIVAVLLLLCKFVNKVLEQ